MCRMFFSLDLVAQVNICDCAVSRNAVDVLRVDAL